MLKNLFDLTGKNVLITGSGRGLGLVFARGLGQVGANIILNGRNKENLQQTSSELAQEGINTHLAIFDVTQKEQIQTEIARVEKEYGPIDVLVNNAGIQRRGPLETFEEKVWQELLDTNLTSVFLVSQAVAPAMIVRQSGKIINICSLQSEVGRPTIAPYTASKGGIKMLTKAMAVEWGKYNMQVNGIGPGYFKTEMTRGVWENPELNTWICNRTPAGRWGDPSELVGAAIFLASEASNFINGQIIYVDGGILAAL